MSEVYATKLLLRSTCNSLNFLGEYLRRKAAFSCETSASCTIFAFFDKTPTSAPVPAPSGPLLTLLEAGGVVQSCIYCLSMKSMDVD